VTFLGLVPGYEPFGVPDRAALLFLAFSPENIILDLFSFVNQFVYEFSIEGKFFPNQKSRPAAGGAKGAVRFSIFQRVLSRWGLVKDRS
jgi:hypothetical protein